VIDPASKKMQLELLGAANHVYVIEASANLVDWVKVGTSAADAQGKVNTPIRMRASTRPGSTGSSGSNPPSICLG
jgi:hypothetical protein